MNKYIELSRNNTHRIIDDLYLEIYKDLKYNFGICDMILKQKIPEPFQMFYTFIKEHYINNYDKLLTFIQSRKTDEPTNQIVSIYSMNTHIDYFALENKLIQTKLFIDSQK